MKMPILTRRQSLVALAGVTVPPTAVVAVAAAEPKAPSVDDFLAKASPAEIARYHVNALADVMAEMHPEQTGWRTQIDHECGFALVACRPKSFVAVDGGS